MGAAAPGGLYRRSPISLASVLTSRVRRKQSATQPGPSTALHDFLGLRYLMHPSQP
ncbi:hypothetical protein EJ04DRAFT_516503 [Polyplosphaeria fusca]|uniref:Uncharacterized protein n=1 Tax=Polyplosphaeria fusca TaxID=682080 RepID=A0A9P4QMZ1_9PLEO|nr:hypothetical protein EJ04DRAFT_516503 [Polyplosphaeria fusca]